MVGRKPRVLEITRAAGGAGGAAIAAWDLHTTISSVAAATILVAQPSEEGSLLQAPAVRGWNLSLVAATLVDRIDTSMRSSATPVLRERRGPFSRRFVQPLIDEADVVQVYWTDRMLGTSGLLELVRSGKPVVLVPMDFSMLTGGCHYPAASCERYSGGCEDCPLTNSSSLKRRIAQNRAAKLEVLSSPNVRVVAGNGWYSQRVQAAGCAPDRVHVIHTPVSDSFHAAPTDEAVRSRLGIAPDAPVVCVGALKLGEPRKRVGAALALGQRILNVMPTAQLVVVGSGELPGTELHGDRVHRTGALAVGELAEVLKASDLFISASIDDGGPMMVAASLSAGAAVASPAIGYAADVLEGKPANALAGRLISPDHTDLDVDALVQLLQQRCTSRHSAQMEARALATTFARSTAAASYGNLYQSLLSAPS